MKFRILNKREEHQEISTVNQNVYHQQQQQEQQHK